MVLSAPPASPSWVQALLALHARGLARTAARHGLSPLEGFLCVEGCLWSFCALPQARALSSRPDDAGGVLAMMMDTAVREAQLRGGESPAASNHEGDPDLTPETLRLLLLLPTCGVTEELGLGSGDRETLLRSCASKVPAPGHPLLLSEGSFDERLRQSDSPVLVHFWATWCGPCRMIAPFLGELSQGSARLLVAEVDAEASPALVRRFRVRALPTLILFRGAAPVDSLVGATSQQRLLDWLDGALRG